MNALPDDRVATRLDMIAVVLTGIAAFLVFVGPLALLPENIAWLSTGDPAQHFLGWQFFRNGPWTFPLGLNPLFGLELANGIAYSDSIPGLAILFKALSPALPPVFQYFGAWLLACFVLQAWFGWKLAGLVTPARLPRLLIAALFASAPPLLLRASPHLALSGHFLILAALYLVLRPGRRHQAGLWLLLLVTAALTSAYLLMMAGALWLADLADIAIGRKKPWRRLMAEAGVTVGAILLALWQAGFFAESDKAAGGFGIYRFNLLSLIDANGWSYVLPDLPGGPGDYEGFNFLGGGVLVLAVVAIVVLLAGRAGIRRHARRWPFLLVVLAGFTLFAMSNHIGIGSLDVTVPIPHSLLAIAGIFRASGRVFWPVFYVLVLTIAYLVVRGTPGRVGATLLAAALALQVVDTSAYWRVSRSWMMSTPAATWPTPLTSPFWDAAGARYRELRRILPENSPPGWDTLGYFAATHRMGTDIVYFPRIGRARLAAARAVATEAVDTGRYRADALYIVDPLYLWRVVLAIDRATDLLAEVDGQYVVAPGWITCGTCPPVDTLGLASLGTAPVADVVVSFGSSYPTAASLASGWSDPEPWGVWSSGTESRLVFAAPQELTGISLVVDAFTPGEGMTQRVVASVNGHEALRTTVRGSGSVIDIPVSNDMRQAIKAERSLVVTLGLPDAVSPAAAGVSDDPREIAIGLRSVTLH